MASPSRRAACMICAHKSRGHGLLSHAGTGVVAAHRGLPPDLYDAIVARAARLKREEGASLRDVVDLTLNDPTSSTTALVIGGGADSLLSFARDGSCTVRARSCVISA